MSQLEKSIAKIFIVIFTLTIVNALLFFYYQKKHSLTILSAAYVMFSQTGTIDTQHHQIYTREAVDGFLSYGPYVKVEEGMYRAFYTLSLEESIGSSDDNERKVGFCDVNVIEETRSNSSLEMKVGDFRKRNSARFVLPVEIPAGATVEFRVFQYAGNRFVLRSVMLVPCWHTIWQWKRTKLFKKNALALFVLTIFLFFQWLKKNTERLFFSQKVQMIWSSIRRRLALFKDLAFRKKMGMVLAVLFLLVLEYGVWQKAKNPSVAANFTYLFGIALKNNIIITLYGAGIFSVMKFCKKYAGNNSWLSKTNAISLVSLLLLVGFSFSVVFHYYRHFYQNLPYPYATFLFSPHDRFNDFFNVCLASLQLDPYYYRGGLFGNYPPFMYIIARFFTLFERSSALFIFNTIFIVLLMFFMYFAVSPNRLNQSGLLNRDILVKLIHLFVLCFLSYPFLFLLDRGNFESLVFIFLGLFVICYLLQKHIYSILFLSLATAMKGYPVLFIVLYFADKKYREAFLTVGCAMVISVISFLFLKGGFAYNWHGFLSGMKFFQEEYVINMLSRGVHHNASLFAPFKIYIPTVETLQNFVHYFFISSLLLFAFFSLYIIFIEKELWKKVALLTVSMILFSYISFDYKLIHLLIPLALIYNSKNLQRGDIFYVVAFALLLIPKDYLIIRDDISIGVIVNPLLMVLIAGGIIVTGLKKCWRLKFPYTAER